MAPSSKKINYQPSHISTGDVMNTPEVKLDVTQSTSTDFHSINDILIKVFKHDSFRTELQRDAVVEACKFTKDIFVSLPTGSGKSLIYQLPAIYKNHGLTIVVSPLLALMNNQIMHAERLGIPTASINSHKTKSQNTKVKEELKKKDSHLRLLYLTPETLCSDHFRPYLRALHKDKCLKMFAIDEAHCVSSWGHEFRPDYLKLGQLRVSFPDVPILALTATATEKVYHDIVQILQLKEPKRIIASTFRKNLFYDVILADELTGGVLEDLTNLICDCLGIKRPEKKARPQIETVKRRKLEDASAGKPASSGGQFVSAASLLFEDKIVVKKSNQPKKVGIHKNGNGSKETILVKESSKISSFFKPKVPEVIDLCSDDETGCGDKADRKQTKSPEIILEKPVSKGVGIVYCRTKIGCEDVATYLNRKGVRAQPYHSGLTSKERCEIEKLWIDEKVQVICATISFGMGIDKANVRVVVHYNMSQSLANYYQESGRAGRDGQEANCRLYFSKEDYSALMFLLKKDLELEKSGEKAGGFTSRKRETALAALDRFERMVKYCKSSDRCRHLALASEFSLVNESGILMNGCGESCDYCVRSRFSRKRNKKL